MRSTSNVILPLSGPLSGAAWLGLVVVFATLTACAGLWSLPVLDRDEARFAQATTQMIESGDFVSIRFQDAERNKKPAGIHWLQAASVTALSDVSARQIWAYRLPSLIGVVLAAVFTALAGMRLYDVRTGALAGLLLASAPIVAAEGTIAKTDGVLLALICLAQLAFLHIYAQVQAARESPPTKSGLCWPALFWITQGAAVLVKGPIGPLVSLLTGAGLAIFERGDKPGGVRKWLPAMRPVLGVLALVLIVAPWGFAIWAATQGRFFSDAVGGDMLGKIGNAQEGHVGPPGYHALLVWLLFWPAAALLLPGLMRAWRERADWRARFLLAWLIPAWIVFEISATKLPHYVMPLYPALAIIAARFAAATTDSHNTQSRAQNWPIRLGALIYGGVGLALAGVLAALPMIYGHAPVSLIALGVAGAVALAAILIAILFWGGRLYAGGLAASILAALYAWVAMTATLPGLATLAVSPRLSTALEMANRHPLHDHQPPVALAGYSEPSAVFLLGTETILTSAEHAAALLRDGAISAAIIEARQDPRFQAAIGDAHVRPLAVIGGLNYSNGDEVALTIYLHAP